jgi:hypothetical protein
VARRVASRRLISGDGQRDHPRVSRGWLPRPGWRRSLGIGAPLEQGGGDGADRQGGHHQDGVAGDGGVETDLGLIQAEGVSCEPEIFLDKPPEPGGADQPGHGERLALGHVAVVKGQLAGDQVAADQQPVPGEAVPSHAHRYQRSPLEPFPADRTSQPVSASRRLAASAQLMRVPLARVR